MDALFGLPRKKAAGKSQRVHGHLFFWRSGDEYVVSYDTHRQQTTKAKGMTTVTIVLSFVCTLC